MRLKKLVRHTVGILIGRKKTTFSHFCISVIPYPIGTKFVTELPASQGSLHTKFQGSRSSHFRNTNCQGFNFFLVFFFFLILLLCVFAHLQNCYTMQKRTLIALKYGTHKVGLAMKKSTPFGLTCYLGDGAYQWSIFKWWVRYRLNVFLLG